MTLAASCLRAAESLVDAVTAYWPELQQRILDLISDFKGLINGADVHKSAVSGRPATAASVPSTKLINDFVVGEAREPLIKPQSG